MQIKQVDNCKKICDIAESEFRLNVAILIWKGKMSSPCKTQTTLKKETHDMSKVKIVTELL